MGGLVLSVQPFFVQHFDRKGFKKHSPCPSPVMSADAKSPVMSIDAKSPVSALRSPGDGPSDVTTISI